MFDLMNRVTGASIKVNISAGRGVLANGVRQIIQGLRSSPETRTLKATLEGEIEPIDLLLDRISERIQVNLHGHYPNPNDVFAELQQSFTNNTGKLAPYFR
jgi:hypothetical protein